ncbi:MAG: glycosyltransferase [Roseburia sp.]
MDETKVLGTLYIPRICFQKVSFLNHRLPAKRNYELMLRLSQYFTVDSLDASNLNTLDLSTFIKIDSENTLNSVDALKTDCYILSRYKKFLLEENIFDEATSSILETANSLGCQDEILTFLSGMLQEDDTYLYYYLGSQPFLIYTGCDVCYHILDVFAEQLSNALQRQYQVVEFFDLSKEDFTEAYRFVNKKYQAVIGVQSFMFSVKLIDDVTFLHDRIIGPKFNFLFDHPIRFRQHLEHTPKNLTIFSVDRDYATFAQQYYHVPALFFPPGGIINNLPEPSECKYDISFIGTNNNNACNIFDSLHKMERSKRFLVNRLWLILRRHPDYTAEKALTLALNFYHIKLDDNAFLALYFELRKYTFYISGYYRDKILKSLLDANLKVDVFGSSWRYSKLRSYPNFCWHENDLTTDECLQVWRDSKLSLNIMSWHKNSITERIINIMLQHSVCLTERNPYLEEHFINQQDLIYYDLLHLEQLPILVRELLNNSSMQKEIACSGYQKALAHHTWDCRAKELIEDILIKDTAN